MNIKPQIYEDDSKWIRAADENEICLCGHRAAEHQEGQYGDTCPCAYCECEGFR